MAVFGKPKSVTCTCYELGHTWTPSCLYASADVALVVLKQALKIYGTLYTVWEVVISLSYSKFDFGLSSFRVELRKG